MTEDYKKQINDFVDTILKAREELREEKPTEEKPKITRKIKKKNN
jgi:hypothetical protein